MHYLLSFSTSVVTRKCPSPILSSFLPGDWDALGCYKQNKKKVLIKNFGRYRIAGLVDRCKEAAERLQLDVFGVGVWAFDQLLVTKVATILLAT